ncbi:hypothetical protein IV102_37650 [bacterium]|nr:hypothetical protein [bacterium]
MSTDPKKKPGRPKVYSGDRPGAPQVTLRLSPETIHHIKNHPEGARLYVERLVAEDIQRTEPAESTFPKDVPGQLLLNGQSQKE